MKNYILFSNATFEISLTDIGISVLFIAIAIALKYLSRFLIKQIKDEDKRGLLSKLFFATLIIFTLFGITGLFLKNFFKLHLFQTEYFFFNVPHIFYVLLVVLAAFFSTKLLETLLSKRGQEKRQLEVKKKGILLIKYLIWLIAVSFILKIVLVDPYQVSNYELVTIKDNGISVFDLFMFSIIFSITGLILLGLKKYFQYQAETSKIDRGNASALYKIIKYIIWVLAIIIGLQAAGFNISLILAGSAALLVGFGIGIQNIFADIVSGFILLLERPLKATDVIEVDGIVGKVKSIGIRTTTLYTRNDTIIRVPNSKFTTETISNWSDLKFNTRFSVGVGVAYGSDVELVMESIKKCADDHDKVDKYPPPFVRFENFGNSSLDFSVYFWSSENMAIENIKSDIRVAIDKAFREKDITIPFPQRDLHIIKDD
jgi:small-conductance mechanosensitive channel